MNSVIKFLSRPVYFNRPRIQLNKRTTTLQMNKITHELDFLVWNKNVHQSLKILLPIRLQVRMNQFTTDDRVFLWEQTLYSSIQSIKHQESFR